MITEYKPSYDLLKKVIDKKKNSSDNFYYYIALRHHSGADLLIDKLINILLSHFNNDIFIYISTSKELYKELIDRKIQLNKLCSYILLNSEPKNSLHKFAIDLQMFTYEHFENINFKYIIYHTQSEYYCKKVQMNDYYIGKELIKNNTQNDINKILISLNNWHWKNFKKNGKIINYFVKNKIIPRGNVLNGLVLTKNMVRKLVFHYKQMVGTLEKKPNWCQNEIIIPSVIFTEFNTDIEAIGSFFMFEKDALDKLINHNLTIKNTIKPVDTPNNKLLDHLHKNYMISLINEYL